MQTAMSVGFTPAERDYIRRKLDQSGRPSMGPWVRTRNQERAEKPCDDTMDTDGPTVTPAFSPSTRTCTCSGPR